MTRIWLYGPYHVYDATNGAQPDWYIGWLIGALRLMPPLEIHIGARRIGAAVHFHVSYVGQVWLFRVASLVVPFVVFWFTRRACRELKETEAHPLRGWTGSVVSRPAAPRARR